MIRNTVQDAAVSAAKAHSHAEVEPRHVVFAAAKQCRSDPSVEPLFGTAKQALEPRGNFHGTPTVSAEATAMLEGIASKSDAIALVVKTLGHGSGSTQEVARIDQKESEKASPDRAAAVTTTEDTGPEATAAILAELESLIGLGPVKDRIRDVIAVVQANTTRVAAGMAPVNPGLHLVFTGPPGTGKTTVARLVARLYSSTGALPGSNFTEASRADLIAGYVGQTAIKTNELIAKTRPGVLFIDEAYALTPKVDADFGNEAIATMVKAMEDYREDLAVIVAGYSDEMSQFVGSNPGLRSRFKTYIDFPDYSPHELTQIFQLFAETSGIALGSGVLEKADQIFAQAVEKEHFGNARFARSLFEQAYVRMAARAAEDNVVTIDELTVLAPSDLELEIDTLHRETRRIGFMGDSQPH